MMKNQLTKKRHTLTIIFLLCVLSNIYPAYRLSLASFKTAAQAAAYSRGLKNSGLRATTEAAHVNGRLVHRV